MAYGGANHGPSREFMVQIPDITVCPPPMGGSWGKSFRYKVPVQSVVVPYSGIYKAHIEMEGDILIPYKPQPFLAIRPAYYFYPPRLPTQAGQGFPQSLPPVQAKIVGGPQAGASSGGRSGGGAAGGSGTSQSRSGRSSSTLPSLRGPGQALLGRQGITSRRSPMDELRDSLRASGHLTPLPESRPRTPSNLTFGPRDGPYSDPRSIPTVARPPRPATGRVTMSRKLLNLPKPQPFKTLYKMKRSSFPSVGESYREEFDDPDTDVDSPLPEPDWNYFAGPVLRRRGDTRGSLASIGSAGSMESWAPPSPLQFHPGHFTSRRRGDTRDSMSSTGSMESWAPSPPLSPLQVHPGHFTSQEDREREEEEERWGDGPEFQ